MPLDFISPPGTGGGGGSPDNMGNHTASQDLVLGGFGLRNLADVSRLGSLSLSDGDRILVGGTRGGEFIYHDTGRAALAYSDEGVYFDASGADDYFSRVGRNVITPEMLGAIDGSDATTEINEAIKAVAAAGGGDVVFAEGKEYLCGEIPASTSLANVRLIGGRGTKITVTNTGPWWLISTAVDSGFELHSLEIDGNENVNNVIYLDDGTTRVRIVNCHIHNVNTTATARGVFINDECHDVEIVDSFIYDIISTTVARGVNVNVNDDPELPLRGIRIHNTRFDNILPIGDGDGVYVNVSEALHNDIEISRCSFRRCAKRAIKIQGRGVRVVDNDIEMMPVGTVGTFDPTSDTWTSTSHGLSDGDKVLLTSSGDLPLGYDGATAYFVVGNTDDTFQLALTAGGSAVDGTSAGVGEHKWASGVVPYAGIDYQTGGYGLLSGNTIEGLAAYFINVGTSGNVTPSMNLCANVVRGIDGHGIATTMPVGLTGADDVVICGLNAIGDFSHGVRCNHDTSRATIGHITITTSDPSGVAIGLGRASVSSSATDWTIDGVTVRGFSEVFHDEGQGATASYARISHDGKLVHDSDTTSFDRLEQGSVSIDASDLTPRVAGIRTLRITAAGSFTDFTGASNEQNLDIFTTVSGVTIEDGTNMKLDGGVDFVSGTNGGRLQLSRVDGVWYQRAKSITYS